MNYQNYAPYQQPFMPQFQQTIEPRNEKIFVQGEDAARAYLVARGESIVLWDDKDNVFYEKHADASGRPSMEIYRYEKIDHEAEKNEVIRSLDSRVRALESYMRGAKDGSDADDESDKAVCRQF